MEGTPKAIEIKGIRRNATKIGVQDGQAEDLINLRFMDGSWRTSGDGRHVYSMSNNDSGTIYTQLYVHTNVYHHLLGVHDGVLYWFAEIDTDGVSFYPLKADKTGYPESMQSLPDAPVALTQVSGDIWIVQTGHLLTIIDEAEDFDYIMYKMGEKEYVKTKLEVNGSPTDRTLFPFGKANFNMAGLPPQRTHLEAMPYDVDTHKWFNGRYDLDFSTFNRSDSTYKNSDLHTKMCEIHSNQKSNNHFTRPFFAIACLKDYAGKYHYASPPVLLNYGEAQQRGEVVKGRAFRHTKYTSPTTGEIVDSPMSVYASRSNCFYEQDTPLYDPTITPIGGPGNTILTDTDDVNIKNPDNSNPVPFEEGNPEAESPGFGFPTGQFHHMPGAKLPIVKRIYTDGVATGNTEVVLREWDLYLRQRNNLEQTLNADIYRGVKTPVFSAGIHLNQGGIGDEEHETPHVSPPVTYPQLQISPADLTLTIGDELVNFLEDNKDLFQSLAIFVTTEADVYDMATDGHQGASKLFFIGPFEAFLVYQPYIRKKANVKYDLLHSPFYLLREYTWKELINEDLIHNPKVDLSSAEYSGLLNNLTSQPTLDIEATARTTYIPKVTYYYNNKLHIANYVAMPFFGYPLDALHLHNHSVKVEDDALFKNVLPNLADNHDDVMQYPRGQVSVAKFADLVQAGVPAFIVKTYLDTSDGEQVVTRYIRAYDYDPETPVPGRADFIEDLNPLLTFPDIRAKKMVIYYVTNYLSSQSSFFDRDNNYQTYQAGVYVKYKEFELTPMPYLNIAYYLTDDLKPIKLSDFDDYPQAPTTSEIDIPSIDDNPSNPRE